MINTARGKIIAPRAFFKSQCIELKVKRGAIAPPQIAMGEHEFMLEELQKMFKVGNIEDKAKLATAISLGWGAQDFVNLEWSFIEPYLEENLEPPVAFWYQREKTYAPTRAHLTHEAIDALRTWRSVAPKSQYVFKGRNRNHITEDALNDWLKSLARRAKIKPRGKIRFHLMRKFLMSQLSSSGMNQWETKLCVGKSIPSDILTYLKDQAQNLREKFMNAESRFTLTGYTNANHSKIDMINEKVETLESIVTKQELLIKEQNTKIEVLTKALTQREMRARAREMETEKIKELVAKANKDSEKTAEAMKKMGETVEKLEKMFEKMFKLQA